MRGLTGRVGRNKRKTCQQIKRLPETLKLKAPDEIKTNYTPKENKRWLSKINEVERGKRRGPVVVEGGDGLEVVVRGRVRSLGEADVEISSKADIVVIEILLELHLDGGAADQSGLEREIRAANGAKGNRANQKYWSSSKIEWEKI